MKQWRVVVAMVSMIILMAVFNTLANAGPLEDLDRALRQVNRPFGKLAAANALAVQLQTDLLGEDDVKPPINIRKLHEPIGELSRQRDSLANVRSLIDVFLRQK